ncbi:MAG: sigma-70 family RNA polymerase sigma factor [Myxococcaceae bacterium]|nr:MAG: sigma-70 family RNA polymerase sigma factor [Myxococcaceae bacterium]
MFVALVQRWRGGLLRVAQAITGNASTAEEVVQETWTSVLRSLETFEGRSSLRTWVHRVCVHVALARIRHDERASVPDEPVVDPDRFDEYGHWREPPARWAEETPEALAVRREVMDCIERTVAMLPVRQRVVITLRDVQGFRAEDACEILGVTAVHQRVLLHRARSRVRAECERFYREAA